MSSMKYSVQYCATIEDFLFAYLLVIRCAVTHMLGQRNHLLFCTRVIPKRIPLPPNGPALRPIISYFLSTETLKSYKFVASEKRKQQVRTHGLCEPNEHPISKRIPRHFGIFQSEKAQFYTLEIHARPERGFYLCFSLLPEENCVELHLKPQIGAFVAQNVSTSADGFRKDDFTIDSHIPGKTDSRMRLEGQAMFDSRHEIYKRFYIDTIGDILAVLTDKAPIHERFSLEGDRTIGFRLTKNGHCKMYICGNQFRLPGCPKIEATVTFEKEDVTQLSHFLERSLRFCIRSNMNT